LFIVLGRKKEAGFRTMAAKYSKNTIFLLLIAIALLLDSSKEEDLELDRQLKLIIKPAIKSF
jgi:hypothetical protein